jgi:hypothetical protein
MMRIIVDRATSDLLTGLAEPVEVYDELGHVLGTFTPEHAALVAAIASKSTPEDWERQEDLGAELDVFGYEHDID